MIRPYLTLDEISFRMKESCSIDQFRRWQTIYLRLKTPSISVREVASICSVSYKTVVQWTWLYNTNGPDHYALVGRGGRRHFILSEAAELELFQSLEEKAGRGVIVTAHAVKCAAEVKVGHEVPKDYAYDLLHRNRWRKIMPHTYHPNGNEESRSSFKKTTRIYWLPPEKH